MVFVGKSRILIFGLLLLQVVVGCGSVDQIPAEPIPVENFIKNPTKSSFQLNPDGSRYAYLASHDGLQRLFVVDLASGQPTCLTPILDSDVREYLWMDSGTLLYQQTASADGCAKIYSVRTDQSEPVCLTKKDNLNFRLVRSSGCRSKGVLIAVSGVGDRGCLGGKQHRPRLGLPSIDQTDDPSHENALVFHDLDMGPGLTSGIVDRFPDAHRCLSRGFGNLPG